MIRNTTTYLACAACLFLLAAPATAQYQFKYDSPLEVIDPDDNFHMYDVAWTGNKFIVVYEDYPTSGGSSLYMLMLDANGTITSGPTVINNAEVNLSPKVVWNGSHLGVLYASGDKLGNQFDLRYYLDLYNADGSKYSSKQLEGVASLLYMPQYGRIIWTGSEFVMFYCAYDSENVYVARTFCSTADKTGKPGATVIQYNGNIYDYDICWDGTKLGVVSLGNWETFMDTGMAQLLVTDLKGNDLGCSTISNFGAMDNSNGAGMIAVRKNLFLVAVAGRDAGSQTLVGPHAYTTHMYVGVAKTKKSGVKSFSLKTIKPAGDYNYAYPSFIKIGKNFYIAGSNGQISGVFFAQISTNGNLGKIINYSTGGCGDYRAKLVNMGTSQVGLFIAQSGLSYHPVKLN